MSADLVGKKQAKKQPSEPAIRVGRYRLKLPLSPQKLNIHRAMRRGLIHTAGLSDEDKDSWSYRQRTLDAIGWLLRSRSQVARRLLQLGWAPGQNRLSQARLAFILSCPVAGAHQSKPKDFVPRYCKLPLICPFCWSREVVADVFERAYNHWYPSPEVRLHNRPLQDRVVHVRRAEMFACDLSHQKEFTEYLSTLIPATPRELLDAVLPTKLNGHCVVTFEPIAGFGVRRVVRAVLALPPERELRTRENIQVVHKLPSGRQIVDAVARATHYPSYLLQPMAPVLTLRVLRALQQGPSRRLRASYGSFRKTSRGD